MANPEALLEAMRRMDEKYEGKWGDFSADHPEIAMLRSLNPHAVSKSKRMQNKKNHPTIVEFGTLKRAVLQYNMKGEFIAEFESIKEAGEQTGVGASSISKNVSGKNLTAGGYVWKYKEEKANDPKY